MYTPTTLLLSSSVLVAASTSTAPMPPPIRAFDVLMSRRPHTDEMMDDLMTRSICDNDDSLEAKCYQDDVHVYQRSRAVLRIRLNGDRAHCTGWLVGDQGHVITNNHCAKSQKDVNRLTFEANAEGRTCETECKTRLGCEGRIVHDAPLTFIATGKLIKSSFWGKDVYDDWTLMQLPESNRSAVVEEFGYLQLRASGPIKGEAIYIPQHPRGWGKKIAMKDGNADATVIDTDFSGGCGDNEVLYKADTQGSSSGSPVIARDDHAVIALHHCGGCVGYGDYGNTAVHMDALVAGMTEFLPASAFLPRIK